MPLTHVDDACKQVHNVTRLVSGSTHTLKKRMTHTDSVRYPIGFYDRCLKKKSPKMNRKKTKKSQKNKITEYMPPSLMQKIYTDRLEEEFQNI